MCIFISELRHAWQIPRSSKLIPSEVSGMQQRLQYWMIPS